MKNLVLVLAAVLVSSSAFAMPAEVCQDKETTIDIQQCFADVLTQKDAELSTLNTAIMIDSKFSGVDEFTGEVSRSVVASSKSFKEFRNDNCDLDSAMFTGGTARGSAKLSCMIDMTEKRIVELSKIRKSLSSK
jgi:uncharacterized protein YecT (DUF1311 family)